MSSASATTGQYYVHINGIPAGYRWKDLKDLARCKTSRGIWTYVIPGSAVGGVRVPLYNEAVDFYNHICSYGIEGHPVHVALWDVTQPPANFLRSNASREYDYANQGPAISRIVQNRALWETSPEQIAATGFAGLQTSPFPPASFAMPLPNGAILPTHQVNNPQFYAQIGPPAPAQQYTQEMQQTDYTFQQQPMAFASAAIPINATSGIVQTEARGVLVKNLDFRISQADIAAAFERAGTVINCQLFRDSSGRSRGSATVTYSSLQEAATAVDKFHGVLWRERGLQVRLLREGQPVQQPGNATTRPREPVVVNGTGSRATQSGLRHNLRAQK